MARRAAKIDANQVELVDLLRFAGASVKSLAAVGDGCPDLLIGFEGVTYLIEVKDGNKVPSKRRLTPDQEVFMALWKGANIYIAQDPESVLWPLMGGTKHRTQVIADWRKARKTPTK
ncbi:MAG: hypothetical protein ACI82F_004531 [Planctomycetota bacterium]|jgi:hypothetical protein